MERTDCFRIETHRKRIRYMLAPYRWICDYADVKSDPYTLADKMVMTGNGVEEVVELGGNIRNVVVGRIEKITKHPDADKLQICMIDV